MAQATSRVKAYTYHNEESNDPKVIKAQIEQTRAQMSTTINEIQEQLSPARLTEQAKHSIKEATIGKAEKMADKATYKANKWGSKVVESVKQNPIPAALIGVGMGWLLIDGARNQSNGDNYYYNQQSGVYYPSRQYRSDEESFVDRTKSSVAQGVTQVQDKASAAGSVAQQKATETAESIQQKAGEVAENLQNKASEVAGTVQEQASYLGERTQYHARQQTRHVKESFQQTLHSNPLMVGAAAVIAGAAVGLLLPSTPKEDELMGETRDRLLHQAQETAKETVQKVQHVAAEAGESAKETAKAEAKKQDMPVVK